MKPYRGMRFAFAVLLAALPLVSCGDATDFAESGDITLTSDVSTVEAKSTVVFTVQGTPTATTTTARAKTIAEECEMDLQYDSEGAGITRSWTSISGTAATRFFKLTPREEGTLTVMARGKCRDSREEWQYSSAVSVTVTEKVLPTVTSISLDASSTDVDEQESVTFTLGGEAAKECTLNLSYQYSGAGFGVVTVNPASAGQFILTPIKAGTLTVTAYGWCSENAEEYATKTVKVTVSALTP